jgi:hypothetical protein
LFSKPWIRTGSGSGSVFSSEHHPEEKKYRYLEIVRRLMVATDEYGEHGSDGFSRIVLVESTHVLWRGQTYVSRSGVFNPD